MALTESEILRRHAFYQTSYIGPRPERVVYTPSIKLQKTNLRKQKEKQTNPKPRNIPKSATPRVKFDTATEALEYRRCSRANRSRPWREATPRPETTKDKYQIFYEGTLPKELNATNLKLKDRKYVSNTKYGDLYILRQSTSQSPRRRTPPASTYVWEADYLLWLNGTRDGYLEELTNRSKKGGVTSDSQDKLTNQSTKGGEYVESRNVNIHGVTSWTGKADHPNMPYSAKRPEYHKSRTRSLPFINDKTGKPIAAVYDYYNSCRLDKTRRKESAVLIQRTFRGWSVRNFLRKLKRKALADHGETFSKLVMNYKKLVGKIRSRYGVTKTSCRLDLQQLNIFMDNKRKYEAAFMKLAVDGKLMRDNLENFLNLCELWPTKAEIERIYDIIFRGSGNTADLIFLLDCSTCIDIIGFNNIIQFIKDIVQGLDIGPNRVRVGVIPYSEDAFDYFGVDAHTTKAGVLEAISKIKVQSGKARTDRATRLMLQMLKESRPGVQTTGIVITDGKSTDPEKTKLLTEETKGTGINMLAIGIGSNADKNELHAIASSANHVFTAADPRSLSSIKTNLERRFCLPACSFCQHVLPRISHYGLLMSEALEVVWTMYPPDAADIGVEMYLTIKTLDENSQSSENSKVCLKLIIQSMLDRHGYKVVPPYVQEEIEEATTEEQALQTVLDFINRTKDNDQ